MRSTISKEFKSKILLPAEIHSSCFFSLNYSEKVIIFSLEYSHFYFSEFFFFKLQYKKNVEDNGTSICKQLNMVSASV